MERDYLRVGALAQFTVTRMDGSSLSYRVVAAATVRQEPLPRQWELGGGLRM